ncbi:hypothetical protein B0H13DRAFT_2282465 [Mycena leptocephala]|nr:hypothetical protein B0H13DRAFT_2282465 [Mycena leptocephala]
MRQCASKHKSISISAERAHHIRIENKDVPTDTPPLSLDDKQECKDAKTSAHEKDDAEEDGGEDPFGHLHRALLHLCECTSAHTYPRSSEPARPTPLSRGKGEHEGGDEGARRGRGEQERRQSRAKPQTKTEGGGGIVIPSPSLSLSPSPSTSVDRRSGARDPRNAEVRRGSCRSFTGVNGARCAPTRACGERLNEEEGSEPPKAASPRIQRARRTQKGKYAAPSACPHAGIRLVYTTSHKGVRDSHAAIDNARDLRMRGRGPVGEGGGRSEVVKARTDGEGIGCAGGRGRGGRHGGEADAGLEIHGQILGSSFSKTS